MDTGEDGIERDRSEGLHPKIPVPGAKVYSLSDSVPEFKNIVPHLGVEERVAFAGMNSDLYVRPHPDRVMRSDRDSLGRERAREATGRMNALKEKPWRYSTGSSVTQRRVESLVARGAIIQADEAEKQDAASGFMSLQRLVVVGILLLTLGYYLSNKGGK
jgi:hypothetical protein